MKPRRLITASLLFLAPLALATPSAAQEFGARYSQRFGNAELSLSLHTGHSGHAGRPTARYRSRPGVRAGVYRGSRGRGSVWVPGRYELVPRRVWVPACSERVWVDPVYDVRCDVFGNQVRVLVREGFWRIIQHPGHFETRNEQVWVSGHWRRAY